MSIKLRLTAIASLSAFSFLLATTPVYAGVDCTDKANAENPVCQVKAGVNDAGGSDQAKNCGPAGAKRVCGIEDFIKNVIDILLFLVGAIAVIMIIVGGIRYVTSSGDSSQTTAAKNTILYAIIGLVLAVMAFAIVNWVIGSLN